MGFKPSFDKEKGTVKVLVRLSYFNAFRKTASTYHAAATQPLFIKKIVDENNIIKEIAFSVFFTKKVGKKTKVGKKKLKFYSK